MAECKYCKCCDFNCDYEDKCVGTNEQHSRYLCMMCGSAVDVYEADREPYWEPTELGLYIENLLKEKDKEIEWINNQYQDLGNSTFNKIEKLEKKIKRKDKEIEKLKERVLSNAEWQKYCAYKHIEAEIRGCLDREKQYIIQLKEKDEEIERCKQGWKESQDRYNKLYLKSLNNTKQVCEKIREKAVHSKYGYMGETEKGYYTIYAGDLEQVEKGEIK